MGMLTHRTSMYHHKTAEPGTNHTAPGTCSHPPLHLTVCSTDMRKIGRIGSLEISASRCPSPLMKLGLLGLLELLRPPTPSHLTANTTACRRTVWSQPCVLTSASIGSATSPTRALALILPTTPTTAVVRVWNPRARIHALRRLGRIN